MGKVKNNQNNIHKIYISQRTVHLGSLKRTIKNGTIINYYKNGQEQTIQICGQSTNNLQDFNICLKHNFIIETDNINEKNIKKTEQTNKNIFPVIKSIQDQVQQINKIQTKKEEKNQEENVQKVRGMKVIRSDQQIISQGITLNDNVKSEDQLLKIKAQTKKDETQKQVLDQINLQGKVVGSVKQISSNKTKKSKQNAQKMAKARAAKRKKQSEQNQKKMKKGEQK